MKKKIKIKKITTLVYYETLLKVDVWGSNFITKFEPQTTLTFSEDYLHFAINLLQASSIFLRIRYCRYERCRLFLTKWKREKINMHSSYTFIDNISIFAYRRCPVNWISLVRWENKQPVLIDFEAPPRLNHTQGLYKCRQRISKLDSLSVY